MIFLAALLFSLVWGALVWMVSLVVARDGTSHLFRPATFLAFMTVIIVPSGLAASGLNLPSWEAGPAGIAAGGADGAIRDFTAPIITLANRTELAGTFSISTVILLVYVGGLLIHLARIALAWHRLRKCVDGAFPLQSYRSRWPLLGTHRVVAPFAAGGRRPVIVIPAALMQQLPKAQIDMIIAHEEAHLSRGDPVVGFVLRLVAALFWFNPFLRDLVSRWHQSSELRADAEVLQSAPSDVRNRYAQTLLAALRFAAGAEVNPLSVPFSLHKLRSQKMRVSKILNGDFDLSFRRSKRLALQAGIGALALIGSMAALTVTSAGTSNSPTSFIEGGWVTSSYGVKRKGKRDHTGVDVAARRGTPILAPDDAVVLETADQFRGNWRWGKAVVLEFPDNVVGWFTHVDGFLVKPGDRIKKGTPFATMGNTGLSSGPHVHIETYKANVRVDPVSVWNVLNFMRR